MIRKENIHGFVLAGGKSTRMGQDKARLVIDGQPLVLRTAELLRPYVREVTLLAPTERNGDLGLPIIADQLPDQGPLAAICTGLLHSTAEWNIFLACDLPLLSKRFIELLKKRIQSTTCDVIAPRTLDGWHPLAAAYHSRCRSAIEQALNDNRRSIIGLFEELTVEAITPEEMLAAGLTGNELANVNTPEDWAGIERHQTPSG